MLHVGAGGPGSPLQLYLAVAKVGRIGVVDHYVAARGFVRVPGRRAFVQVVEQGQVVHEPFVTLVLMVSVRVVQAFNPLVEQVE